MRDPTFDPIRAVSVPDTFEQQMARLRARPRRASPARGLLLVGLFLLVAAACAIPVEVQRPIVYAVRWAVAGTTGESHASARALERSLPEADPLVSTVDPGPDSTQFRYVVVGNEPSPEPVEAAPGVGDVRVEAITEPVRVPLGAWAANRLSESRLSASQTLWVGRPRLRDGDVDRLLARRISEAGIDTTTLTVIVRRATTGGRELLVRARYNRGDVLDGPSTQAVVLRQGARIRLHDGLITVNRTESSTPRPRLDSLARVRLLIFHTDSERAADLARLDSTLRAEGRGDAADEVRRILSTRPTPPSP